MKPAGELGPVCESCSFSIDRAGCGRMAREIVSVTPGKLAAFPEACRGRCRTGRWRWKKGGGLAPVPKAGGDEAAEEEMRLVGL